MLDTLHQVGMVRALLLVAFISGHLPTIAVSQVVLHAALVPPTASNPETSIDAGDMVFFGIGFYHLQSISAGNASVVSVSVTIDGNFGIWMNATACIVDEFLPGTSLVDCRDSVDAVDEVPSVFNSTISVQVAELVVDKYLYLYGSIEVNSTINVIDVPTFNYWYTYVDELNHTVQVNGNRSLHVDTPECTLQQVGSSDTLTVDPDVTIGETLSFHVIITIPEVETPAGQVVLNLSPNYMFRMSIASLSLTHVGDSIIGLDSMGVTGQHIPTTNATYVSPLPTCTVLYHFIVTTRIRCTVMKDVICLSHVMTAVSMQRWLIRRTLPSVDHIVWAQRYLGFANDTEVCFNREYFV